MKYAVLPLEVYGPRAGMRKISYRVVDVDAGLNERKYPKRTVAWSDSAETAERICAMMNSSPALTVTATWQGQTAKEWYESFLRAMDGSGAKSAEIEKWQDKCTSLTAERAQVGEDYRALLNIANEKIASFIQMQQSLRSELAAAIRANQPRDGGGSPRSGFGTPDGMISDHDQIARLTTRVWKLEQTK